MRPLCAGITFVSFTSFDLSCVKFIFSPATRFPEKQNSRVLIGAQGCLLVALICNSLIVYDVEYILYMPVCLWPGVCSYLCLFLMGLFVLEFFAYLRPSLY